VLPAEKGIKLMTGQDYAQRCMDAVKVMREASAEDSALAEFLNLFGLLQEPCLEEFTNG
jgi:hypothetical protein